MYVIKVGNLWCSDYATNAANDSVSVKLEPKLTRQNIYSDYKIAAKIAKNLGGTLMYLPEPLEVKEIDDDDMSIGQADE